MIPVSIVGSWRSIRAEIDRFEKVNGFLDAITQRDAGFPLKLALGKRDVGFSLKGIVFRKPPGLLDLRARTADFDDQLGVIPLGAQAEEARSVGPSESNVDGLSACPLILPVHDAESLQHAQRATAVLWELVDRLRDDRS